MRARALAIGLTLISVAFGSRAQAQPVVVDCSRLDRAARDELRARMRLVLRSAPSGSAPEAVSLLCDERTATLIWEAGFREQIAVDESDGLVEGTLDVLEARLAQGPATRPRPAQPPRPRPSLVIAPPPAPPPPPPTRYGGVGLGVVVEPIFGPRTVGPRIDFGVPIGPLSLAFAQTLRAAEDSSWLVSGEGGLAFGAPYRYDFPLGAVATLGVEALSSVRQRGGPDPDGWGYAWFGNVGARGGLLVGRTTLWLGVDLHRRFKKLRTYDPDVELSRTTVLFSLGAMFGIDLTERRPRRALSVLEHSLGSE